MSDGLLSPARSIGLLCNPLSGWLRGRPDPVRETARSVPGCVYREASDAAGFRSAVQEFAGAGIDTLIIAGGDGTAHGVLTAIFQSGAFSHPPCVALVPAGTTNMTARDLGIDGPPRRVLANFVDNVRSVRGAVRAYRPMLRIQLPGGDTLFGMFFGAGVIATGVQYFSDHVRRLGWTGEAASGIVVARFLAALLSGRAVAASDCVRAAVEMDGSNRGESDYVAIVATTLHRLLLGMRPYWGREPRPVHASFIRRSPRRLWRSLPCVLTGRAGLREADGYASHNLSDLALFMDANIVIDGQIYCIHGQNEPLRLSATDPLCFLCP